MNLIVDVIIGVKMQLVWLKHVWSPSMKFIPWKVESDREIVITNLETMFFITTQVLLNWFVFWKS